MNHPPFLSPADTARTAADFYMGLVVAEQELRQTAIPAIIAAFAKRELETSAELGLNYRHKITKFTTDLNQLDSARIKIPRAKLELFCMLAALNLYLAEARQEIFAAEALEKEFFKQVRQQEDAWLELNNAQILDYENQTGHPRNEWRITLIRGYLEKLRSKSSRDAATLVAAKRFLAQQGLSPEAGVHISPALLESCAALFEHASLWLKHYIEKRSV